MQKGRSGATPAPSTSSWAKRNLPSAILAIGILAGLTGVLFLALGVPAAEAFATLNDLARHRVVQTVALGAVVLGIAGGVLGSFAVLRRQSLLGDTVSHAALPGIYLVFMVWTVASIGDITLGGFQFPEARSLGVVLLGALATGLLATGLVLVASHLTRLKEDAALGIALSTFFGAGVVLRSWLQGHPQQFTDRAGLESFLYGSIATMTRSDVTLMALPTALALVAVVALWKELKAVAFDPEYVATLGFPARALDGLITVLIVLAVVVGLQMVGVVLMSSMLIAPAVAARQWTDRLVSMLALACVFGVASGLVGIGASMLRPGLSTGPVIAVYATAVAVASLVLAPARGLMWRAVRLSRQRADFATDTLVLHLAERPAAPPDTVARQLGWGARATRSAAARAVRAGWLANGSGPLRLTDEGRQRVEALLAELGPAALPRAVGSAPQSGTPGVPA